MPVARRARWDTVNEKYAVVRTADGGIIVAAKAKPGTEAERVPDDAVPPELDLQDGFVAWKLDRFSRPLPVLSEPGRW